LKHTLQLGLAVALLAAFVGGVSAAPKKPAAKSTAKKTTPAKKSAPAAKSTAKAKTAAKAPAKSTAKAKTTIAKVTPAQFVQKALQVGVDIPMDNPAAMIPFFEQLYRHQKGELPGPVRVLQYGDSHTAADEFSGELRMLLQQSFGNGGSGFSFAGKPWKGYRRRDVKTGSTDGWYTHGLVTREGDGVYGLGGVAMSASSPDETVFVETEADTFELFYLQQPGGGQMRLYDWGMPVDLISTEGSVSPAYYRVSAEPGFHRYELETLDNGPVRLFGWVAENPTGITYETLGINGAQATQVAKWDPVTLRDNLAHRNPDLIVLAYGTNEAGSTKWTVESYQAMFTEILRSFREAAPTASILVVGPPDRDQKVRRQWQNMARIGVIAEAQRRASLLMGCAFIDLRAEMGGSGSMLQWVKAGQAQTDHVHFTSPGYRLLGDAVYSDIMTQYGTFLRARAAIITDVAPAAGYASGVTHE
jgi:lysophospholipase L1-like esterase